jgi:6-phosphogluconolactonase (cycloisomerase 2 family)
MSQHHKSPLVEIVESRTLMSAGQPTPAAVPLPVSSSFVYVESNNPNAGQNAVLAYRANAATGALTPLANNRFLTGGTGERNPGAALGTDDSDKEVIASPDGRFLFAVNQGSNTVSTFAISADGSLSLLESAPTPSGGVQPVSLSLNGDHLYVVNRGNGAEVTPATVAPTVASFIVGADGALFAVPSATVTLPKNLSPAQVLTSADGRFEFVDDFATPSNLKVSLANTIEPFIANADGSLTAVKNGAAGLPANPPLVLGLVEDPVHHLIYAGQAPKGGVATFSYNDVTGQVKYVGAVASPGIATCWLNISPDGKYLYGTDSASDSVSVYSLATPTAPKLVQEFYLGGPAFADGSSASAKTVGATTAEAFQFSFDSSGKHLFILDHTTSDAFQQGNQLHTLDVGTDGKLTEPTSPLFFSAALVPAIAHPEGLAVVTKTTAAPPPLLPWISAPSLGSWFADGGDLRKHLADLFA